MEFPFEVPTDLSVVPDDALITLLREVREHAKSFGGTTATQETVDALTACRDLVVGIEQTLSLRNQARELSSTIDAATAPTTTTEPATDMDDAGETGTGEAGETEEAITAAKTRNPTVRDVAARRGAPDLPTTLTPTQVTMRASTDVPGRYTIGQELTDFSDVVRTISHHLDRAPRPRGVSNTIGRDNPDLTPAQRVEAMILGEDGAARYAMKDVRRVSGVEFQRNLPDNLTVREGADGYQTALYARDETRLPGGSLVESFKASFKRGTPITAASGWCAPSQPIYGPLCDLASLDGILDVPELMTEHGGWQIPANGGPNFATVWSGVGNSGDTHLTEAQVIAESPSKYCYDIPCPSFTDVRLGVDYICLTGSLLQRRGYPEVVKWYTQQAMTALPHKINMGFIAAIVTASGAATVIPADPSGDDAISSLLSAIDLAITDAKYRLRSTFNGTLEVVLPMWVLTQLRAAGSRRAEVNLLGMTDAEIVEWMAIRKAVPRFVYDWQDSFSALATGPGGATPLTALPQTVNFLVYPAGTWVKAVQPVVSLDTVYDSTKLLTNEYTAVFTEDGWAALQMCPLSRLYTAAVDPSGCLCSWPQS